jgi:hypothetical protein
MSPICVIWHLLLQVFLSTSSQEVPAFPGAEGFGRYTTGGRGGKVLLVTNLNDDGPGSLREAIRQDYPRTIVFRVSGNIQLKSNLEIRKGDLTIAGQSAPGEGICLTDYPVRIAADNVIIRYLRSRLGDRSRQEADAISAVRQKNIIIDHCSFSWATDECASFYDNENFTLQWSIVSEALNNSVHHKGNHGYGGIWGGKGASFHHNLLAHNASRNPRLNGSRYHKNPAAEIGDFRNNVIYNWQHNSAYGGEEGNYNLVANYYKAGPATYEKVQSRIFNPSEPLGRFFVANNYVEGYPEISKNNWQGGIQGEEVLKTRVEKPFERAPVETLEPQKAFEQVLAQAGASLFRDPVDQRVVQETRNGTAAFGPRKDGIIDSQDDVGGWSDLKMAAAPVDKDLDGMPDLWEEQHQLDPANPDDHSAYSIDKIYTNLEIYLNDLVTGKGL